MEVARRDMDPFQWNFKIPVEFYRVPLFLIIEALVSGRIIHEAAPVWVLVQLWTAAIIPLFIPDEKLLTYYRLVLAYIGHCMLNLVDNFLLNLDRPTTAPIWGLIGISPMDLTDFQYLVRVAFMLFNLVFFRAMLSNFMIVEPEDEESRWSLTQLPALAVGVIMLFANCDNLGNIMLFGIRIWCLRNMAIPVTRGILRLIHDQEIADRYLATFEEENSDPDSPYITHLRVLARMALEQLANVNPAMTSILQILLHSMIFKSFLHAVATATLFNGKVDPVLQQSPDIRDLQWTSMNSSGVALLNMTMFGVKQFSSMQYFAEFVPSSIFGSIVLITTDSLLSVFAVAYFLSGPGVWLGVAIQRWLGNGQEPNDPEERGQRMGQFLGMLHGFMALQTGITFMSPEERFERAYKNSWLEAVACLHYLHEIVDAELNNAPEGRPMSRPLQAMFALLLIPLCIEIELVTNHPISTWSIPVFVFTLELIVKALTSFAVYVLVQQEADEDTTFWTKTASKGFELFGGVVMLVNAIYVLVFERPIMTVVRILMMTIHTYFNIYRTFTKTSKTIRLRLQTAELLDKLKVVDVSEIPEPDRLCAICYEDFIDQVSLYNPVVETSCQHRFHKLCIKKWLRLKNVCPLCHRPVFTNPEHPEDDVNRNALILDDDDDDDVLNF